MSLHHFPWKTNHQNRRSQAADQVQITFFNIGDLLRFTAKAILDDGRHFAAIAREAKVCQATVSNLAHGATRFPRCESILKILATVGYKLTVKS